MWQLWDRPRAEGYTIGTSDPYFATPDADFTTPVRCRIQSARRRLFSPVLSESSSPMPISDSDTYISDFSDTDDDISESRKRGNDDSHDSDEPHVKIICDGIISIDHPAWEFARTSAQTWSPLLDM